jgi:hypothetical protein
LFRGLLVVSGLGCQLAAQLVHHAVLVLAAANRGLQVGLSTVASLAVAALPLTFSARLASWPARELGPACFVVLQASHDAGVQCVLLLRHGALPIH